MRKTAVAGVLSLGIGLGLGGVLAAAGPGPAQAAKPRPGKDGKDGSDGKSDAQAKQKQEAKQLFDDGMIRYDLRKFDEAITAFESAFKLFPDPAFLFNIAQAHRMAGHNAEAIGFYKNYLRRMPGAANESEVKAQIAQLEKLPASTARTLKPLPPATPYLERKSKHSYPSHFPIDGVEYTLTGVGYRSYIGFLLYGIGMYLEDEPARRAFQKLVAQAGGSELAQLRARDLAQSFIVLGEFGKCAVLHFTRDLTAKQIRESYRDLLKENLKASAPPQLREQTEQFLALFARDVKGGEDMQILTEADGRISVAVGADKKVGPTSPRLAIDLWNLWLGPKPISEDLKQSLVERIQALGDGPPPPSPK